MANIKRRDALVTSGGKQLYEGAGLLVAAVFDHHASASGTVVTMYDGRATTDTSIFTRSSDTDAGTTVPVTVYGNGDLVAGTATDNVKVGIPFANGLFLNKTGDTTHEDSYKFFIIPLIRKSVQITTTGSAGSGAGSAPVFAGPGLLHGIRIVSDILTPSTADFNVHDTAGPAPATFATAPVLLTKTNYAYAAPATRAVVTLTGTDEGGTAVSTAATGAYASLGIFFVNGLYVMVQQANAQDAAYQMDFLIES